MEGIAICSNSGRISCYFSLNIKAFSLQTTKYSSVIPLSACEYKLLNSKVCSADR